MNLHAIRVVPGSFLVGIGLTSRRTYRNRVGHIWEVSRHDLLEDTISTWRYDGAPRAVCGYRPRLNSSEFDRYGQNGPGCPDCRRIARSRDTIGRSWNSAVRQARGT